VRVAPTGTFPKDFSWAVIETPEPPAVKVDDTKEEVPRHLWKYRRAHPKSPLLIDFLRDVGDVLVADDNDLPMAWGQRSRAGLEKKCQRSRVITDWETKPGR